MKALRRVLNISPGEDVRVLVLALGWAFITGFTISGKAARDAIFLSRYDRSYLPLMVVAIAVAVAVAIAACSRLSRIAKPREVLTVAAAVSAVSVFLFRYKLEGWMIPALYIWVEVATVIMGLEFWLLASELVDSRQAKRLFGLVAGGGSLAAIAVGSQLKPFVKVYGAAGLLPLVAAFAVAAGAIAVIARRLPPVPQPPQKRRKEVGVSRRFDGYLASIAVVVCAAAVASTLVDYQFKIVAAKEIQSEADLAGFFGMFSAATGFSSLMFQFVVTGRVLSRLGIVAGLALLPLGLGLSSAYLLLSPVLAAAALAKFCDQTLKFTVHNSGLECLWLPVPYARRQEVKPWITGTLKSSAEGLSGLVTFFLVKVIPLSFLSFLVLGACAVWFWTLMRLRGFYSSALEKALSSRSIENIGLQLDALDPATVATVERSLTTGDVTEQLFALELIRDMPLGPWNATLRELLKAGPPDIQRAVLEIAGEDARVIPDEMLVQAADRDAPVAAAAIRAGLKRGLSELASSLQKRTGDPDPGTRAAAARALYGIGFEPEVQERVLEDMLTGGEREQLAALTELTGVPALLPDDALNGFLRAPSREVRRTALTIAAARGSLESIPPTLDCLADRETSIAAREALLQFPPGPVSDQVANGLNGEALTTEQRVAHVRFLRYLPPERVYPLLCNQLTAEDPEVRLQVPESLLVICRRSIPPADVLKRVEAGGLNWVRSAYVASESLRLLPLEEAATLLRDHFEHSYLRSVSGLFKLLAIRRPTVPVETCLQILASGDKSRLSFVLDLLDSFLPIAERKRVLPLFEPSVGARGEAGRRLFADLPGTVEAVLEGAIQSQRDWEQAIGLDYTFRTAVQPIYWKEWSLPSSGPLSSEVLAGVILTRPDIQLAAGAPAAAVVQRKTFMYSTLEKTIILKSTIVFGGIAAETLSRVAQMAEEVSFSEGSMVYRDGEPGAAMYVVASGAIRVRTGAVELGVFRRGESIGEIAVLNRDTYRADVIAVEDSVLLRIEQDDIFDLMQSSTEIMQGIIGLLARRVVQVGGLLRESGGGGS